MSFIITNDGPTVRVKLTDKGRELITKGTLEEDFDIVKFAFGDSDIDYSVSEASIGDAVISSPPSRVLDLTSKLYQSGIKPTADVTDAYIKVNGSESASKLSMSTYSTPESTNVEVMTVWDPFITGAGYRESYSWENLGPLNDWDFKMTVSADKKSATIESLGITGVANIKIKGQKSNQHGILTLTIA